MKCFSSILSFFIFLNSVNAQQNPKDSSLPYLKNLHVPGFKIIQSVNGTDTTWFTNDSVPKNKSLVIIYFNPDCSHCQYEAKEIVRAKDSLNNAFFVWVTYRPSNDTHAFTDLKAFEEKYKLNTLSNSRMGIDPKYFIPAFFRVEFTPFMVIYRNDQFIKEFREGAKPEELIAVLQ